MNWHAQPKANGCAAWTSDKHEAELLAKVMRDLGLKTKIESERQDYKWYGENVFCYSIRVIGGADDVLRGREIRRGFKVAMQLRGDVYDFLEGLRAGLREAERVGVIRTEKQNAVAKTPRVLGTRSRPLLPAEKEESRA